MPSNLVSTLLQRVEDEIDAENFVDQAVLLRWLNAVYPRFVSKMYRLGWAAPISTAALTTGSGTYALDVMAVIGVYMKDGTSYKKLMPIDHMQKFPTDTDEPSYFRVSYTEAALFKIDIFPTPPVGSYDATTFVMDYVAAPTPLAVTAGAGVSTSLILPSGWEEWLVLELARRCLSREETINPALEERFKDTTKDIEQQIRDYVFTSAKIRNVDMLESEALDPTKWTWL